MLYKVLVSKFFSAAHRVRLANGEWENIHGHNYKVEVCISSKELNKDGMVIDFLLIDNYLHEIIKRMDHSYLNENPDFIDVVPTCENIAKLVFFYLSNQLDENSFSNLPKVEYVKVYETEEYASIVQNG
jgi:6-pyruvoyltetrahydropterin/6-carboxytetrahydropterin synthase